MMRGKSPPSELLLEIIKSNNSLRFLKQFGKGDNFNFCQNIILFYYFTFILIKRAKLNIISLFILIKLKFAIFTRQCSFRTKFYNEIDKSFARIHNLITRF